MPTLTIGMPTHSMLTAGSWRPAGLSAVTDSSARSSGWPTGLAAKVDGVCTSVVIRGGKVEGLSTGAAGGADGPGPLVGAGGMPPLLGDGGSARPGDGGTETGLSLRGTFGSGVGAGGVSAAAGAAA